LWQRLGPRLVPTSDVRAALALAAADERTAAIVYRTDLVADRSGRLRVEASLPMPTDVSIELVGAALRGGQVTEARAYLEFLSSPTAAAVARRHGFGVTGSDA
ncbi:MAG: substrate-binding domain-containing protein, partial [Acidobacteriota bacterium]